MKGQLVQIDICKQFAFRAGQGQHFFRVSFHGDSPIIGKHLFTLDLPTQKDCNEYQKHFCNAENGYKVIARYDTTLIPRPRGGLGMYHVTTLAKRAQIVDVWHDPRLNRWCCAFYDDLDYNAWEGHELRARKGLSPAFYRLIDNQGNVVPVDDDGDNNGYVISLFDLMEV